MLDKILNNNDMKKICFVVLAFLSCAAIAGAQDFRSMFGTDQKGSLSYGVRAGYNVSNFYGHVFYGGKKESLGENISPFSGGHIYGIVDIPVTNGFYIQSGLGFSSKGSAERYKDVQKSDGYYSRDVDLYAEVPFYLEIPVLASFRADVARNVNLQVGVGPYFAVAVGGRSYDIDNGSGWDRNDGERWHWHDVESSPMFSKDGNRGISRFDTGLTFTAGVTLFRHYYAGISYDIGLNNIMNRKALAQLIEAGGAAYMHNGTFSISVGYTF